MMSILRYICSGIVRPRAFVLRGSRSHCRSLSTYVEIEDPVACADPGVEYEVILPPEPYVFGVEHIQRRIVPQHIKRPPYIEAGSHPRMDSAKLGTDDHEVHEDSGRIQLGSADEQGIRQAGKLAAQVRNFAGQIIQPGLSTNELDAKLHEFIVERGAYPSPLLYRGFPKSCCTSVNNIICHGIPDDRKLVAGDIVNVDITVYLNGFHGDTSRTFLVGGRSDDEHAVRLITATEESLAAAIAACRPGVHFRELGKIIFEIASTAGFSVSHEFMGHGIGRAFHRSPWIWHTPNDEPGIMMPGHAFTIEPCLMFGFKPRSWIWPDGWTASTMDGSRSAQAEHTILITEEGHEILTL